MSTPPFVFEDVVRTTMGGATNAQGNKLSPAEIDKVIAYLKSPGSGVDATHSYADYVTKEMAAHPPKLPAGVDYVAFSGTDAANKSNYKNASEYVADTKGRADIIGHTPWGEYIEKCKATAEFKTVDRGFTRYLASEGIEVYGKNTGGALQDMMWNAGSAPYMENAVHSGRPIVAFVENAPPNRGFSNFELPEALKSPKTIVNGHPISDFGPNPLAFASKSAGDFQKLEQSLADGTLKANGQKVTLAEFRADVRLIDGYNAAQKTVFGQPLSDFSKLKFEQMSGASKAWNVSHTGVVAHPPAEPRVGEARTKATELHPPTGPPKSVIGEGEVNLRIRPGEAAKGAAGGEVGVGAMAKGALGVVGTAAVLYDAAHTSSRAADMRQQGNVVGANSEVGHFYARTGGMLAGAEAGAAGGALVFSETGPGALIAGGLGGIVGAIGGEKLAQAIDYHHIYNQTDQQGNHWHFDPKQADQGWTRLHPTGELDFEAMRYSEGMPVQKLEKLTADPALKNQLDYKASNVAIGLTLAHPPTPRDPYTIPANEHDTRSLREAPWTRSAETHQWSRTIAAGLIDYRVMDYRTEVASPQRAAELERSSRQIVADNLTHSAQHIAQDYKTAYEQRGWNQFGGVPPVVTNTLKTQGSVLEASDGHTYTRDAKGQWNTPGMIWGTNAADGNIREELNTTRQAQQAAGAHTTPHITPTTTPITAPASPAPPLRLDDPKHPDHSLFDHTRAQVAALDQKLGRKPDQHTDNITAAVVVQARADGLSRIDQVALSADHSKLWATQATPGAKDHFLDRQTSVPTAAANIPMEQSAAQWPKAMQQYQETQAQQSQQPPAQPNQQQTGPGR
ncbi:XVIPCD domain-containing protein [Dyella sp. 2RAB6]|uniref:XVIPCD domain-containing protein n=1 Tax=Dyella sp. 2RAB6 TaxID=3232992 RepID=UPI003F8F49F9